MVVSGTSGPGGTPSPDHVYRGAHSTKRERLPVDSARSGQGAGFTRARDAGAPREKRLAWRSSKAGGAARDHLSDCLDVRALETCFPAARSSAAPALYPAVKRVAEGASAQLGRRHARRGLALQPADPAPPPPDTAPPGGHNASSGARDRELGQEGLSRYPPRPRTRRRSSAPRPSAARATASTGTCPVDEDAVGRDQVRAHGRRTRPETVRPFEYSARQFERGERRSTACA